MSEGWAGGSDTRWRKLRAAILRLDLPPRRRPQCAIGYPEVCVGVATHVDHIVPLSMGGEKYDPGNCRPACRPCNLKRGNGSSLAPDPPSVRVSSWSISS